jgi:hypothetical protein
MCLRRDARTWLTGSYSRHTHSKQSLISLNVSRRKKQRRFVSIFSRLGKYSNTIQRSSSGAFQMSLVSEHYKHVTSCPDVYIDYYYRKHCTEIWAKLFYKLWRRKNTDTLHLQKTWHFSLPFCFFCSRSAQRRLLHHNYYWLGPHAPYLSPTVLIIPLSA